MTIKAGYKIKLFLALALTAVVCVTLPFLAYKTEVISVYPQQNSLNATEKSFISALKKEGYDVKISPVKQTAIAIWFRFPNQIKEITASTAKYNFMYTEEHYPFDWYKIDNLPIILTPHQDLYEHYVRSNLKSARISITPRTAAKAVKKLKEILNWLKENQ